MTLFLKKLTLRYVFYFEGTLDIFILDFDLICTSYSGLDNIPPDWVLVYCLTLWDFLTTLSTEALLFILELMGPEPSNDLE